MLIPRAPAHSSVRPENPRWQASSEVMRETLCAALGGEAVVYKIADDNPDPYGYYRVALPVPLFVKVLPNEHAYRLVRSACVENWLYDFNLPVINLLKHISIDSELSALVFPYVDGRFSDGSLLDMKRLGFVIAKLHEKLAGYFNEKEVSVSCVAQLNELKKMLNACIDKSMTFSPDVPGNVIRLLGSVERSALDVLEVEQRQVVHGDLNYGNIIFDKVKGEPYILDFEKTLNSWFSPEVELSYVIERFVLCDANEKMAARRAEALLSAYRNTGGRFDAKETNLVNILCALSIRSLLLLVERERRVEGRCVEYLEWMKFMKLYDQAKNNFQFMKFIERI